MRSQRIPDRPMNARPMRGSVFRRNLRLRAARGSNAATVGARRSSAGRRSPAEELSSVATRTNGVDGRLDHTARVFFGWATVASSAVCTSSGWLPEGTSRMRSSSSSTWWQAMTTGLTVPREWSPPNYGERVPSRFVAWQQGQGARNQGDQVTYCPGVSRCACRSSGLDL